MAESCRVIRGWRRREYRRGIGDGDLLVADLHQAGYDPVLLATERTALANLHHVANMALILRVMRLQLMRSPDRPPVKAMLVHDLHGDHHRFAHLVAGHF